MTEKLRDNFQYKIRFQGRGTFIDVWLSPKKGCTIGVYKPDAQACYYKRNMTLVKIEDELVALPSE